MDAVKQFFHHKSFYLAVLFALWVLISFIVTVLDSNADKENTKLNKSKYFQLVSVLLFALYALWYILEIRGFVHA